MLLQLSKALVGRSSTRACVVLASKANGRSIAVTSSNYFPTPEETTSTTHRKNYSQSYRHKSTISSSLNIESMTEELSSDQQHLSSTPYGNLFNAPINETILQKTASIRRTFTPQCNAQAMLICGGSGLAHNASFDPQYDRAVAYIRNHAVGPAVLSPVLIGGLVGTLVEAALPQSFVMGSSLKQVRPLIVGMEVEATIQVVAVTPGNEICDNHSSKDRSTLKAVMHQTKGYELILNTEVKRVSDGEVISEGEHQVWLPDYS